jgi:CubicO group peptidase (beta-lactamase class C family)
VTRALVIAGILFCWVADAAAGEIADRFPDAAWEHVDPASAGWSAEQLKAAEEWSGHIGSTAVMVVHHGAVVAEWGDTAAKTQLASVRKSLLSALIGIAVERKQIVLAQPIGELGIDDNEPSLTSEEKTATVRDLLEARSGIYHAALYETPAMAARRPPRFSHKPGTFWYYNNWDFNALGAIYEHATRSSIFDAFEREIARPIGMQDYTPADGEYVTGANSVYPAYPFKMSARDLARFALLYLHHGKWQDRQIVPADWVGESTQPYSRSGFGPGYGYLWWTGFLSDGFAPSVTLPSGSFFAWGNGGQFAFVMPAFDLVFVHRANRFSEPGFSIRDLGHLLWLVLDAGHFPGDRVGCLARRGAWHSSRCGDARPVPGGQDAALRRGRERRPLPHPLPAGRHRRRAEGQGADAVRRWILAGRWRPAVPRLGKDPAEAIVLGCRQ